MVYLRTTSVLQNYYGKFNLFFSSALPDFNKNQASRKGHAEQAQGKDGAISSPKIS